MNTEKNLYPIDIPCTATKICLSEREDYLLVFVATWDGKLISIKYDEKRKEVSCEPEIDITNDRSKPVLAIAALDYKVYVSAEVSEEVWAIYQIDLAGDGDFDIKKQTIIGTHTKPINQLVIGEDKRLYSFGYDGLCQVWDLNEIHSFALKTYKLEKIVTQVQKKEGYILCVLEGKSFALLDTNDTQSKVVYFSVKSEFLRDTQITSLSINEVSEEDSHEDMLDFAVGTIDGRVIHCEYFLSERHKGQNPKAGGVVYTHQMVHKNRHISFPVNAIAYHRSYFGLLFSGGAEGKMKFHDFPVQKMYKNIFKDLMPVSHILVNSNGEVVVVAKGYGWHPDENKIFGKGQDEKAKIYIYVIDRNDLPQ